MRLWWLAGRSGAGKTLLTRILAGLLPPDSGGLIFNGRSHSWPFQAKKIGISLIHQDPMLVDQFDITTNIFLGHELKRSLLGKEYNLLHQRKMDEEARCILAQLDVEFPSLPRKSDQPLQRRPAVDFPGAGDVLPGGFAHRG